MPKMSHGRAMTLLAEEAPERLAIVHGDERATRLELERRSNRLARAYAERGVGPGALVTIALPNGIEFLVATLAVWKLGGSPQPISARLPGGASGARSSSSRSPRLIVGVAPARVRRRVPERARPASRPTRPSPTRRSPTWCRRTCGR